MIEDGSGENWVAYNAWPPDAVYPGRVLWIDRLKWEGGKSTIEGATEDRQRVPAPL